MIFLSKHAGKRVMAFFCAMALVVTSMFAGVSTDVLAAGNASIEINGFQISSAVGGYRTVYSVNDPSSQVTAVGLIYGIAGRVSDSEMVVNSSNSYVKSYQATSAGKLDTAVSGTSTYVMTMKFLPQYIAFYSTNLKVKAYAKLSDGSYVYTSVSNFTIYDLAKNIYTNSSMPTQAGHDYLYNNILKVVNPSEAAVAYNPPVVEDDYVTANGDWNNGNAWSTYFAPDWGGLPTGAIMDNGTYNDYGIRIDTASDGADWSIQAKTQSLTTVQGATYRATAVVTSNKASTKNILFKDDITGATESYSVAAGTNTFTVEFTAAASAKIFFELSGLQAGTTFVIDTFTFEQIGGSQPTETESVSIPSGDNINWDAIEFAADGAGGGAYANKYKFYSPTENVSLVNIQHPGFADEDGLYVTFPAGISAVSLPSGTYHIEGAGVVLYLSAFESGVTSFTVTYAGGQAPCYVRKYDGSQGGQQPSSDNQSGGITAPTGLVASMNANAKTITIAFSSVAQAVSYNLYLNNNKYGTISNGGTISYTSLTEGATYTIGVTAVASDGTESAMSSTTTVTIPSGNSVTNTTTSKQQQSDQITYGYYPKDTSLPEAFGIDAGSPADNTISVVWGAGNPNRYNVYIDNVLTWTGLASYHEAYGYVAGNHTITICTYQNGKESAPKSVTVHVSGLTSGVEPTTDRSYNTSNRSYPDPVPQLPQGVDTNGKNMYVKINNRSNGQYTDAQCYWVLVGLNENKQNCYVNKYGQAVPMKASDNTVNVNGQMTADYSCSLAECSLFYAPNTLESGRLYLSYGKPVYLTVNDGGYAGPSVLNSSDPNYNTLFEFAEFTITNGHDMFTNTTRVDFFSFPIATRLVGSGGWVNGDGDADTYDVTVGDMGTRAEIISQYLAGGSDMWDTLYDGKRIMAPCKSTFDAGKAYGNYYDAYINEFWNKYTNQDLVFRCEGGNFTGRVQGDVMVFHKEGDNGTYYINKPTTQDVLEGKGAFNNGNGTEKVIEAQLCAAFTRGVACDPNNWSNEALYYKSNTYNYYAGFFHTTHYDGFAYGFCYDDVFDHSTLLHYTNATGFVVDMKF